MSPGLLRIVTVLCCAKTFLPRASSLGRLRNLLELPSHSGYPYRERHSKFGKQSRSVACSAPHSSAVYDSSCGMEGMSGTLRLAPSDSFFVASLTLWSLVVSTQTLRREFCPSLYHRVQEQAAIDRRQVGETHTHWRVMGREVILVAIFFVNCTALLHA